MRRYRGICKNMSRIIEPLSEMHVELLKVKKTVQCSNYVHIIYENG